jgi:DNA-binding MarR family transcriptional regulator
MSRRRTTPPYLEPPTGFLIVRVAESLDRRFAARLKPLNLKPRQLHVLRYLDASGALSQAELAEGINIDAANLVELLDQLETRTLIRRQIDTEDRRRRRIELTAAGSRKLRAGVHAAEQAEQDVLGTLAPKRLSALRDLMLDAYAASRPTPTRRA